MDKERLLISRDDLSVALTRLRVIDVYGRVWKDVYLDQQFEIKTEDWPSGCYCLCFTANEGLVTKKWVKY